MPLRKRLAAELCPTWREQGVNYKQLQREAENLVGNDDEEPTVVFRFHANVAMEQASEFYESKVKEMKSVFEEVAQAIGGVHDLHRDRAKCTAASKIPSPSTSTEHLWNPREDQAGDEPATEGEEETPEQLMKRFFAIWKQDAQDHCCAGPRKTCLSNFVDDNFMLTLEESALKDALREFLQMLVYIDRIRNFALLNCIVIMKIAQRHCDNETCKALIALLQELPIFKMTAINVMIPDMEELARKLHQKLSGTTTHTDLPSSWSLHVCPFCSHTVTNAVTLPVGQTCCWKCVAQDSSNALVYCPVTSKPVDIKELRLERVLVSFLRRFFPSTLKDVPAPLIGTDDDGKSAADLKKSAPMGMLAALKSPNLRPKHLCKSKVTVSRRQRRLSDEKRPPSLELEKLEGEVSAILKGLASPKPGRGSGKSTGPTCTDSPMLLPLRRRKRSISCQAGNFPNLDELFLSDKIEVETPKLHVLEPRNMRGFPLCSATCWCIERQAAVCLDLSITL